MKIFRLVLLLVLVMRVGASVFGQGSVWSYTGRVVDLHKLPGGGFQFVSNAPSGIKATDAFGQIIDYQLSVSWDEYDQFFKTPQQQYVIATYSSGAAQHSYLTWTHNGVQIRRLKLSITYRSSRVCATDEGFLIARYDSLNPLSFLKLNWDGDTIWEQFHPIAHGYLSDMVATADGGVCLLSQGNNNSVQLIKTDSVGNIQWNNTYAAGMNFNSASRIIQNAKGQLVVVYTKSDMGEAGMLVVDQGGALVAENPNLLIYPFAFCETSDHYYVVAGTSDLFDRDIQVLKLDSSGHVLLDKKIILREGADHYAYNVVPTDVGGWVIGGKMTVNPDGFIISCDSLGNLFPNKLVGKAIFDQNHDCAPTPGEAVLKNWPIIATRQTDGRHFYATTDVDGRYEIDIDTGDYLVSIQPPGNLWHPCQDEIATGLIQIGDTSTVNFLVQDSVLCSLMDVSVGTGYLRRCFDNQYVVNWCNLGTSTAENAAVHLVLPPELSYVSSTLPLSAQSGDTLHFEIGAVGFGACGSMQVILNASCTAELGQTLCVQALISPDSICNSGPGWSGARIIALAQCLSDTAVEFRLKNIGTAPTSANLEYIITEDWVVLFQEPFSLPPNEELVIVRPANGTMQRISAQQEPQFPFPSNPAAAIEGCGLAGPFSLGFINQYALDDGSPFADMDCHQLAGSFDPNDKQGFPIGYKDQHFIEPGTDITYQIRFQNTGTDTAFTVEVRDTLSPSLDPASLRPGASSHPYTWSLMEGGNLRFRFEDILLPDSNVNEPLSHGFVQFRISQKPDIPLGTQVLNRAGIYFDFNAPVMTNTTLHTVQLNFYAISLVSVSSPDVLDQVLVAPNPFTDHTTFTLVEAPTDPVSFRLFDSVGRLFQEADFSGKTYMFSAQSLPKGVYWFEIRNTKGQVLGRGKVVCFI